MTWPALLLTDRSPSLRLRALCELLGRPDDDPEVVELRAARATDPLATELVAWQGADGGWFPEGAGGRGGSVRETAWALTRLGYLGWGPEQPAVQRGADFLFARQRADGAWPLPRERERDEDEGYSMVPLQTALPLRGLAACGYATDPRCERAYDWLLAQRLDDGAWPTGTSSGVHGGVAGYRRLAHSRWGCRTNTTGALICLALHPERRGAEAARRALDLVLGRETREAHVFGCEVARLVGAEPARGFFTFYARYDLALVLDLCARVGATRSDPRVDDLVRFAEGLRGPHGLWDYPTRPQVGRWLTFGVLRALARIDAEGDWLGLEPRTPFAPYGRRARRSTPWWRPPAAAARSPSATAGPTTPRTPAPATASP